MTAHVADMVAQARSVLLSVDPVDWTGPAAAAFHEDLGEILTALVVLGHAAAQTEVAIRRHQGAVSAAPMGAAW